MTSVWIPPQQQSTREYVRWATISSFVIAMLYTGSVFYDEYKTAQAAKATAIETIAKIQDHNKKVDADNSRPPETKQVRITKRHRTLTLVDGNKICTDPAEGAKTGCKIVTDAEMDKYIELERQQAQAMRPPPPQSSDPSTPKPAIVAAGGPKLEEKTVTETKTVAVEQPKASKIEIDAKLIKMVMDGEASWSAIIKMIVTVLTTFFGVRLINFVFSRLEQTKATA